jgi:polyphosphate kinase
LTAAMADELPDADVVRAMLDRLAIELGFGLARRKNGRVALVRPDGTSFPAWHEDYPYTARLGKNPYAEAKRLLQIELLKLQRHVKRSGDRVLIIFEGRDAAGKGGTIRRFTENLNPRGLRVVALDKPAQHERGDSYLRRYLQHLPGPGEIVLFDRSWYNRAGVEAVMGFCPQEDYARFLLDVPAFERQLAADGITIIKLWFSVTRAEQLLRFAARQDDPVKRWKLSPTDLASLDKWHEYTFAKEAMFRHTDVPEARWTVIKSNDKRRARLEAMRYVLSLFDYDRKESGLVGEPDPLIAGPVSSWLEPPADAAAVLAPVPARRVALTAELSWLPRPQPADLVQGDTGRDAGIQRLRAGDRDLDDRVALLCDEPR